jgi:carbon monoxide dehydrogenase subunit G
VAEWDPSIRRVVPLDPGPVHEGSRFRVYLKAGPASTVFRYRVLVHDAGTRHAMFDGVGWAMRALDDVRVEPEGTGSRITWRVELSGRGLLALTEPAWRPFLRRFTERVIEGLRQWVPEGRSATTSVTSVS